jgi:hypothetical protein
MKQIKISPRYYEERVHNFYCDGCGKYLGQSLEYDDGWYEERGYYILHKHLCKKCESKLSLEIEENLRRLDFKLESEMED